MTADSDLVVVGAGIVGLAHAVEAVARGISVTVVDRDERAVGASVQNFGHGCITAQVGAAQAFGEQGRGTWLRMAREAGFWAAETGTLVVARAPEELACLTELAELRDADDVVLLTRAGVLERAPVAAGGLLGGGSCPATSASTRGPRSRPSRRGWNGSAARGCSGRHRSPGWRRAWCTPRAATSPAVASSCAWGTISTGCCRTSPPPRASAGARCRCCRSAHREGARCRRRS